MINSNRVVSVTTTDLITLYGTMMKLAGTTVTAVDAADTDGNFAITSGSGNVIANEPVKTLDFGESVTSMVAYFVPAFDYAGFSIAGVAEATTGDKVVADGKTLYSATLSSGDITIAKVSF